MKWINAEQQVTVTIYDEEHEEHLDKIMTVEEMLDTYTNEGCPTMYSNPERKKGKWIIHRLFDYNGGQRGWAGECSECGKSSVSYHHWNFCPNCGSRMDGEENG